MARIILEEFETLIATARSTRDGETGRLAVGFCTSLSTGNLRASLLDFRQRFPQRLKRSMMAARYSQPCAVGM
jgi:DNA-binding transcriptional LysR family regulator